MAGSVKFINSLFVKNLLESKFQQTQVVVKKHTIESTSGYVHRINIRYSSAQNGDATLQLIALVRSELPSDEGFKEWILLKEASVRFAEILRPIETAVQFVPKVIHVNAEPAEVLILEDGPSNGFVRSTSPDGLNLADSLVVIEKLATLHAASVVYFGNMRMSPVSQKEFFGQASLLDESSDGWNFFGEALASFVDNAESMKIPGSVVQKLRALQPRLLAKSAEDFAASLNGFRVLNHGNVWTNNILLKRQAGKPTEALLIDFKTAFIGSPIIDLMFLLTTSVAYDVTRQHKDQLLYAYHTRLSDVLTKLKYTGNVPSLVDFHLEFLKRGIFELMLTLTVAPYLRSVDCPIRPSLRPPFVNRPDLDLAKIASDVLATHAEDIIEELDVVENNGLLDWGVESSHLKRLLSGFQ